jgi:hypothetical protein
MLDQLIAAFSSTDSSRGASSLLLLAAEPRADLRSSRTCNAHQHTLSRTQQQDVNTIGVSCLRLLHTACSSATSRVALQAHLQHSSTTEQRLLLSTQDCDARYQTR